MNVTLWNDKASNFPPFLGVIASACNQEFTQILGLKLEQRCPGSSIAINFINLGVKY